MWKSIIALTMLETAGDAICQCPLQFEDIDHYSSIGDSILRNEVLFTIPWVREYDDVVDPEFQAIPASIRGDRMITFMAKDFIVELSDEDFDPNEAVLTFDSSRTSRPHLCMINRKPFYGTHGKIPKRRLRTPIIKFKGHMVEIPDSAWNDLYQPNFASRTTMVLDTVK